LGQNDHELPIRRSLERRRRVLRRVREAGDVTVGMVEARRVLG
jgi:hypothetical protein